MLKIIIKDRDFQIKCDNGKIIRTPKEFFIPNEDKIIWEMKLKSLGIRDYNIVSIERPKPVEKPKKKVPLKYTPIRPSIEKIRNEIENGKK